MSKEENNISQADGERVVDGESRNDKSYQGQASVTKVEILNDPRFEVLAKNPRRTETLIAVSFFVAALLFIAMIVDYLKGANTQVEGGLMAAAFCLLGVGMVAWGKYLMPKGPFEEPRHELGSTEEDKKEFVDAFVGRGKVAVGRRSFLGKILGAAMGLFGLFLLGPLLRSLGPNPGTSMDHTAWKKGSRVVSTSGNLIHVNDLDVGAFMTVFPEGVIKKSELDENQQELYNSQTLLIRAGLDNITTEKGRESWGPQGYLAFSKVCTHAGCPISLYQQETQQLLCPCHQSLFNILDGAMPIFGPAPRPLPQLPLAIDAEGYLYAQADYDEPIGPGYWGF